MDLKLSVLSPEDHKVRGDLIMAAYELITEEKINVPKYTDEDVVNFVLEWQYPRSLTRERIRQICSSDSTIAPKVYSVYSHDRLYILYRFAVWCEWFPPVEIVRTFKDTLKLFMAIRGAVPEWWATDIPFQALLRTVYVEVNRWSRARQIREYLANNWSEAVRLFEDHEGIPSEDFPVLPGTEYSHIYTQYKKMVKEKRESEIRQYLVENPSEKERLCQLLKI